MQTTATQMTTEDQLVEHVARLARKTEALDDFAGLVAHDVKSSLIPLSATRIRARTGARTRASSTRSSRGARDQAATGVARQ
jgi:hypothetical protein